jgi:hypothetical protein
VIPTFFESFHQFAPQRNSKPAEGEGAVSLGFAAESRQDHHFHPRQQMQHLPNNWKNYFALKQPRKGPGIGLCARKSSKSRWTNPHQSQVTPAPK